MNYVIFDTETTSLNSPFCYNIGYVIINELGETLLEKEYIVEQIWHNIPLFSTSYYAEKRPIYVQAMRQHKIKMDKFGYICQAMKRDFKKFHVAGAYAYNSNFDEKVFDFNCDWFKCINPFEEIHIMDIRGNVHEFLFNEDYKRFCNNNQFYTDSGCYSSTAEIVYRYITNKLDFIEAHTALSDSLIEKDILLKVIDIPWH